LQPFLAGERELKKEKTGFPIGVGNDRNLEVHPHPAPLPSREREFKEKDRFLSLFEMTVLETCKGE
jgi:hypothetical protein